MVSVGSVGGGMKTNKKMKFEKPTVGQLVFVRDTGDRLRSSKDHGVYPVRVKKVGRKYFTLEHKYSQIIDGDRFYLDTWKHDNKGSFESLICYPKVEHHMDEISYRELYFSISESFDYTGTRKYTLDQLIRIADILDEGGTE